MHCINNARTFMREHREIVQHCWKHAGLNSESTALIVAEQPVTSPTPEPALPDAIARANAELDQLLHDMAPHFT